MTAYEIISEIFSAKGLTAAAILLTLVQITPIKINPWSYMVEFLGKNINKSINEDIYCIKRDIQNVCDKVDNLESNINESKAINSRTRILCFGEEISRGQNHTREHFKQILSDITLYNNYCIDNPKFQNNMTKITTEIIEEDYKRREINNNYL